MNKVRTIAYILILVFLCAFPQIATASSSQPNIDLRESSMSDDFYETLDGQWIWFEEQILLPSEVKIRTDNGEGITVLLPSSFKEHNGKTNSFATYSTTVKIPQAYVGQKLSLYIPYQYSAYVLFVNDAEVARNGVVGTDEAMHEAEMAPRLGHFVAEQGEIQLTMHVSSFSHIRGGVENTFYIGEQTIVAQKFNSNMIVTLFINGCIFIIGFFMVLFAIFRRKEALFLIFGLFAMLISVRATFAVPFYYTVMFLDINWLWGTRLEYVLTEASSMFYVILLWKWHENEFNKKYMYFIVSVHLALIFTTFFTQPVLFQPLFFYVFYLTIPTFIYVIYVIIRSIRNNNRNAKINLVGMGLIFLAFFNDFAIGQNLYKGVELMLPAVGAYVIIHVVLMSNNFAKQRNKIEEQYNELLALHQSNEVLTSQLQQEMKRKDEFLTTTSHELKNPLHGIINISESLLNRSVNTWDEQTRYDLQLQLSIARHLSWTLEDLLDLTKLKEHRIHLQRENVSLRAVSIGVVNMLSVQIGHKDITLEVNVDEKFPQIYVDRKRIIQILFNVVHNAIKFTEKGEIVITSDIVEQTAYIHISDTGRGMSEKDQQRIFEPYEQVILNNTNYEEGLGLGLSISKQLVALHGGSITVQSKLNQGSIFTIMLPLAVGIKPIEEEMAIKISATTTLSQQNSELVNLNQPIMHALDTSNKVSKKLKVLVVDDNAINLQVIRHILSSEQYELECILSAKEVLEQLEWNKWDLIILDVMMPEMSGYDVTRVIREKYSSSELPILLLTARSNSNDIYAGFAAGANDYVTKPVDAIELNVRVKALTDLHTSIQERLKMEAAWLHAQIRPHFLLNTLNSIISLSRIDVNRMHLLLEKFTHYLQSSFYLKNLEKEVELQAELELIEAYIYIEKERFDRRLSVIWNIEEVGKVMIPPLVMQTLVENAVNHGVLMRIEGGTITISVKQQNEHIAIYIEDDGIGMDETTRIHLFNKEKRTSSGIGIINANQRLTRLYGQGLSVESEVNKGTKVSFIIPKKGERFTKDIPTISSSTANKKK